MTWYRDRAQLQAALDEHGSVRAAAKATGTARGTLRDWAQRYELTPASVPPAAAEPADLAAMRRRLERSLAEQRSLQAENRELARGENLLDDIRDLLAPVVAGLVLPKPRNVRPAKPDKTPVSLVLHLCDLHWGEIVDPDLVSGDNAYSPEIAARRLQHGIDTTLLWVDNYTKLAGVDEIVVVVNGDTVSGQHNIHPDSADEYARIAKQVLDAGLVLAQAIRDLASNVRRVRVVGTQGNHPRSTRRMPTGRARSETSWETLLHEFVAALLVRSENVDFHIARGYKTHVRIGPSTWAFAHGDAMKGGGGNLGVPAYALKRTHDATRDRSVTRARSPLTTLGLDDVVKHTRIGHFHLYTKWQVGEGDIAITPSPKGVDPFVTDQLEKYSPAAFLLEAVHPEHDVIGDHVIGVQHIMDASGDCRYAWGALTDGTPAAALMPA